MEWLGRILIGLLELLKGFILYDYGKTREKNQQLKENEKLREEYEDIDDMDISARCYINKDKPYWRVAYKYINAIFWFQENHCKESFDADIKYAEEVQRYVDNNR